MGLFVTEIKTVALATLVIVASETVGVAEVRAGELSAIDLEVARIEQVVVSSNKGANPDWLVMKSEAVGVTSSLVVRENPLFVALSDSLKVWEWRVFPLGEHEVYGVPIRVFMKGRI